MGFRQLKKSLKLRLTRYPSARRLYDRISRSVWIGKGLFPYSAKRSFARILGIAFPMWIEPRVRLAQYYFHLGKPDKAAAIVDDLLARRPDATIDRTPHNIAVIYHSSGRIGDAHRLFERMETRRHKIANELQYDRLGLRVFSRASFTNIGPLGLLDKYIKANILGIIPRRTNMIFFAPEESHNPSYVRYWQKYLSMVTHPRALSLLAPLVPWLEERSSWQWCGGNITSIARRAQLQWEAERRSPLLELSSEHRERGWRLLHELGMPEGTWFVGLHVREGRDQNNSRNADVTTYQSAIEEIAKRGGWVLRMGNNSMRPLPNYPNTIDYAHSARRQDWMDVFLWAEGRFFIGTASGPQLIPTSFGKPVAITNYGPIATMMCGKDDILLPKHYWLEKERRYLTLSERANPSHALQESPDVLAKLGIRVVDNTPEELRELVIEMIDRLEGRHEEIDHERALQTHFAELAAAHQFYPVKIARPFLSSHPELLGA
jgi:putative glycosyltransferase (TIGR04372 family)